MKKFEVYPKGTVVKIKAVDFSDFDTTIDVFSYPDSITVEFDAIFDGNGQPRHYRKIKNSYFMHDWIFDRDTIGILIERVTTIDSEYVFDRYTDDLEQSLAFTIHWLDICENAHSSKNSSRAKDGLCFLYILGKANTNHIKIGISSNPKRRVNEIQNHSPEQIKLLHKYQMTREEARKVEYDLHKQMIEYNLINEWFSLTSEPLNKIIEYLDSKYPSNG